jgi:hypothetical protein
MILIVFYLKPYRSVIMKSKILFSFFLFLFLFANPVGSSAHESFMGQLLYVPVYSHIYIGDSDRPFLLSVTLSIRNTSRSDKIRVTQVDYYDSNGNLLKKYVDKPVEIKEFSSIKYVVRQSDKEGGSGAKFLVRWESSKRVSAPVVESIMIGASSQQGISFSSIGQELEKH